MNKQENPTNKKSGRKWLILGGVVVVIIAVLLWWRVPLMAHWYFHRAAQGEDTSLEIAALGQNVKGLVVRWLRASLGQKGKVHDGARVVAFRAFRHLRYDWVSARIGTPMSEKVWYADQPLSKRDRKSISLMVKAFEQTPKKGRRAMLMGSHELDFRFSYALNAAIWNSRKTRPYPHIQLPQPEFAPKSVKKAIHKLWCKHYAPVLRRVISGRHPTKPRFPYTASAKAPWELLRWKCAPKQDRLAVRDYYLRVVNYLQKYDRIPKGTVWKKATRSSRLRPLSYKKQHFYLRTDLFQWIQYLERKAKPEHLDELLNPFLNRVMGCRAAASFSLQFLGLPKRRLSDKRFQQLLQWFGRFTDKCAKHTLRCHQEPLSECRTQEVRRFKKYRRLFVPASRPSK